MTTPLPRTPHDAYPLDPHHAAVVDGTHVALRWEPSDDAETYAIEVSEDPEFRTIVYTHEVPGTETEFIVPVPFPEDDRLLYWRVSAGNAEGWSAGARIESFISGMADQAALSPEPEDSEPYGPLPSLLWSFRRQPFPITDLPDA